MFTKLTERKVFRDPLYGYINIDYKIISDLIDTKEFQRLRRIKQLAGVSMVFQTAEHSRFTHSLGTYELARLVLEHVNDVRDALSEYEQVLFLIVALLHDIGHGPYSHSFEHVFSVSHECMSSMIVLGDTEVNKVLSICDGLAKDVSDVINQKSSYKIIEQLTSSQLDVDRMDYLCRDSHFTGTPYGNIDVDKILRSMRIKNSKVVYKYSGAHTIENYLLSRHHMYWQVYYHPVSRCYEIILEKIYHRIKELMDQGIAIEGANSIYSALKNNDLKSYLDLDDSYMLGLIKNLENHEDEILRELSVFFIDRKLFKVLDLEYENPEVVKEIRDKYANDFYHFSEECMNQSAYYNRHKNKRIYILLPNNEIKSLEEFSPIVNDLLSSGNKKAHRIYYKDF